MPTTGQTGIRPDLLVCWMTNGDMQKAASSETRRSRVCSPTTGLSHDMAFAFGSSRPIFSRSLFNG